MTTTFRVIALVLACACVPSAHAEASRFDGAWDVAIDCPSNSEPSNARGYAYHFAATVRDGMLAGGRGKPDEPGSLAIEGPIAADGTALLRAQGRTGDPAYAVKHPGIGSPYGYRIEARFDEGRGSGVRLEARECTFVFTKR